MMNLTIKQRLVALTFFAIFSLVVAIVISLILFKQFDNRIGNIYDQRVIPLKLLKTIADDYTNNIIGTINKSRSDLYGPEEALPVFIKARSNINKNWLTYLKLNHNTEEAKLIIEIEDVFKDAELYLDIIVTTLKKMGDENDGQLDQFDSPLYVVIEPILEKITSLVNLQLKIAHQERDLAGRQSKLIWFWFSLSGLAVIIFLSFVAYLITASITRPINKMRNAITDIDKNSDLTIRIENTSKDEVGMTVNALNAMISKFNSIINQVNTTCSDITSMITQVVDITEKTNKGMSKQKSDTHQLATAMNEMAATSQEVANHATSAAQAANKAELDSNEGQEIITSTINSINTIANDIETASKAVNRLATDSDQIGTILDVIKNIAEQTNLLALNAAIEAARAGEQGRGFAVVADEVRSLASRTQISTEEIQDMIERLQSGASEAVNAIKISQQKTHDSAEQSSSATESLNKITASVNTINHSTIQVSSATNEQLYVAEEMNKSIVSISEVAGDTEDGARQITSFINSLANVSHELEGLVSQFKI